MSSWTYRSIMFADFFSFYSFHSFEHIIVLMWSYESSLLLYALTVCTLSSFTYFFSSSFSLLHTNIFFSCILSFMSGKTRFAWINKLSATFNTKINSDFICLSLENYFLSDFIHTMYNRLAIKSEKILMFMQSIKKFLSFCYTQKYIVRGKKILIIKYFPLSFLINTTQLFIYTIFLHLTNLNSIR